MNKEISDSLYFLLHCALKDDEYETQREQFEIIYKYIENLERENQELKAKIKTYEDPDDLTLMFMYCDEKAKDKIKELNKQLEDKYSKTGILTNEVLYEENTKLINQQKEFIKYMENEINKFKELEKFAREVFDNNKIINIELAQKTIEENNLLISNFNIILLKYKEIIGGN